MWQVTAPAGQRVYAVVNSYVSEDRGRLYFGPDPDSVNPDDGPGVAYYNQPIYLDLVSRVGHNNLWFGVTARRPFADDSFEVTFRAVSETGMHKLILFS